MTVAEPISRVTVYMLTIYLLSTANNVRLKLENITPDFPLPSIEDTVR